MAAFLLDWASLLLRWAHIVTGVAWIGASFYFVSLDNRLTPPKHEADADKGVGGEQWGVHGGGFYHHQKYPVSPGYVPDQLHWSMWESYATWLTGFALFTVLYLYNASTFLIDKTLFDWSPAAAVSTALAFFVAFWLLYDAICRTLGRGKNGDLVVGGCVLVFAMMSNHHGFTYGAKNNWLVLVAIMVAGALIRLSLALRHKALACGKPVPWHYAVIGTLLLGATLWGDQARFPTSCRGRRAGNFCAGAGHRHPALRDVPWPGDAEQKRSPRLGRRSGPACADDLPASRGAEAHAGEQRHPDHR